MQGRTAFDDLNIFKNNEFYADSLNIKGLASVERVRQRLDEGAGLFDSSIRKVNLALLSNQQFSRVKTLLGSYIPWDCDLSPVDNSRTKKQNVSRTYKDYDGYAPMFGYLGGEGFMLDCELRPGKQHCQSRTVEFLKRGLGSTSDFKTWLDKKSTQVLPKGLLGRAFSFFDTKNEIMMNCIVFSEEQMLKIIYRIRSLLLSFFAKQANPS